MSGDAPPSLDADLAGLQRQVAALTDFVTTVTAALVVDRTLTAAIVRALLTEAADGSPRSSGGGHTSDVTVSSIAHDVLAIAGRIPMPSPVRLVYNAGASGGGPDY